MDDNKLRVEGDINISPERRKWDQEITDTETARLLEEDARYFLHQSMSSPCLDVLTGCSGSRITTLSGKHILDFHGNNVHQLGYGNSSVVDRITEQMKRLSFSPRRYTNRPAIELAKKLSDLLPGSLNRSLFAPGGTSAVSMAVKLARIVTGKHKVISNWDSFHGASLDAISVGGEAAFKMQMGPLMPGVICIPPPMSHGGVFGGDEAGQIKCADFLEYVIEKEGEVGAFLAETVRNTDVQIPAPAYWKRIQEICRKHRVLLILDEIPVALGRTGKMFAFENYEIEPDIICLGKGLGGGIIPFAAMVARDEFNVAKDVSLGHFTHEKSPLGCAAAIATINFIESEGLLRKVSENGAWFGSQLYRLKERFSVIGDIRGIGLLWGIEIISDMKSKEKSNDLSEQLMYECMRRGLSFKVSQGNVLQLSPALTIAIPDLQQAVEILGHALNKITGSETQ